MAPVAQVMLQVQQVQDMLNQNDELWADRDIYVVLTLGTQSNNTNFAELGYNDMEWPVLMWENECMFFDYRGGAIEVELFEAVEEDEILLGKTNLDLKEYGGPCFITELDLTEGADAESQLRLTLVADGVPCTVKPTRSSALVFEERKSLRELMKGASTTGVAGVAGPSLPSGNFRPPPAPGAMRVGASVGYGGSAMGAVPGQYRPPPAPRLGGASATAQLRGASVGTNGSPFLRRAPSGLNRSNDAS